MLRGAGKHAQLQKGYFVDNTNKQQQQPQRQQKNYNIFPNAAK